VTSHEKTIINVSASRGPFAATLRHSCYVRLAKAGLYAVMKLTLLAVARRSRERENRDQMTGHSRQDYSVRVRVRINSAPASSLTLESTILVC